MAESEYTPDYVEQVFYTWHDSGRKTGNEFLNKLPKTPSGKSPSKITIANWVKENGWVERADALDAEISMELDRMVVDKRKKMWERQAEIADELIEKGMAFLTAEGKGIQSDASAIRAIDLGLNTQRISTGMAEAMVKISKMSDEQLTASIQKLLGKKDDDTVDAEIINEE